jgi:DDE domain
VIGFERGENALALGARLARRYCCIGYRRPHQGDSRDEITPASACPTSAPVSLLRVPVPARGHHPGGPLVPALRPLLPDVEELLAERGVEVDHVSVYRWVQRFAPEFAEAARARQHIIGDRWHVDDTYLKVDGSWRYLFRAIDEFGQIIEVYLSPRLDAKAARRFFERAIGRTRVSPVEITTDRYRVYPRVLDELLPAAFHETGSCCRRPRMSRRRACGFCTCPGWDSNPHALSGRCF